MRPGLHTRKSLILLAETAGVFALLLAGAMAALRWLPPGLALPAIVLLAVAQGLWLDRLYTVAHEAVHLKLFPGRRLANDLVGMALMVPVVAPFTIFRRIHGFHHGGNRRDRSTAALDHMRLPEAAGAGAAAARRGLWYFYVFAGGFFLHTLAAILIFLLVPERRAARVSPVFRGWPPRLRLLSWAQFLAGIGFHAGFAAAFGGTAWLAALGLPMLVFAWFWSMLLYVYHYRTSVGRDVRLNVRSLPRQPLFSWLLLNFNEHSTHHGDPAIPWYDLPRRRASLPPSHAANDDSKTLLQAVLRQRAGPVFWSDERP
jgi:fatty acid desaturase